MTTKDLYELAALDVMGLLDEDERAAFERAFRAADPAVQADLRREQLRYTDMDALLPAVEAPPGLRARVVDAVKDAIAAIRLEPIAKIGPGSMRVVRSAAPLWRAACIGFAAATLVLAGFVYHVIQVNNRISQDALSNRVNEELAREYGAEFASSLARFKVVSFSPAAPDVVADVNPPVAQLYFDPARKRAYLFCDRLPIDADEYTLVVQKPDGSAQPIERFKSVAGGMARVSIDVMEPSALGRMAIHAPADQSGKSRELLVVEGL